VVWTIISHKELKKGIPGNAIEITWGNSTEGFRSEPHVEPEGPPERVDSGMASEC
jgi:hypothetical protein